MLKGICLGAFMVTMYKLVKPLCYVYTRWSSSWFVGEVLKEGDGLSSMQSIRYNLEITI